MHFRDVLGIHPGKLESGNRNPTGESPGNKNKRSPAQPPTAPFAIPFARSNGNTIPTGVSGPRSKIFRMRSRSSGSSTLFFAVSTFPAAAALDAVVKLILKRRRNVFRIQAQPPRKRLRKSLRLALHRIRTPPVARNNSRSRHSGVWALGCYWRKDGTPLWRDRELLARDGVEYGFGVAEAQTFSETLARRLGLNPEYVAPAFEDQFYHTHQERRLPVNVDTAKNKVEDPLERGAHPEDFRSAGRIRRGDGVAVRTARREWQTGLWRLRGDACSCCRRLAGGVTVAAFEFALGGSKDVPEVHAPDPTVELGPLPVPEYGWAESNG